MAQSKATKMVRILVRLSLVLFLFGFFPLLIYKKSCTPQESITLDDAYGKTKPETFGAEAATENKPATPGPANTAPPDAAPTK